MTGDLKRKRLFDKTVARAEKARRKAYAKADKLKARIMAENYDLGDEMLFRFHKIDQKIMVPAEKAYQKARRQAWRIRNRASMKLEAESNR